MDAKKLHFGLVRATPILILPWERFIGRFKHYNLLDIAFIFICNDKTVIYYNCHKRNIHWSLRHTPKLPMDVSCGNTRMDVTPKTTLFFNLHTGKTNIYHQTLYSFSSTNRKLDSYKLELELNGISIYF